jgi:HK97 family phage major capsid protein
MNLAQLERDLLKKTDEAAALLASTAKTCQAHEDKDKDGNITATGRLMSADEKNAIQALIDEGNVIKTKLATAQGDARLAAEIQKLTGDMALRSGRHAGATAERRSMGQQFVESEAMAWLKKGGRGGSAWTSPSVELHATTLDETNTSGGDLIVTQYQPGVLPLLFKRLVVADLLAKGTTDSTSVTYMKETTFTNAAAAVAEGQLKPESTLAFDQVADAVAKIAHWLPVTDEMLDDVSQIRSYIDARLRLGLDIAEEDQLLNGNGTAPNMTGLLTRSGLTTATVRAGSVTNAEAIFVAMMAVFNGSFVMPTGTILNPSNWQTTQLSKDGNGRYYGTGPFGGPQLPTLWGLPVVVTPSIVANTGLTGAYNSAAQVFRKGGVRVEASNSHSDFFIRNLTAIRCEERAALAVYRPAAFSKITSLT